jgi:hypothetical protein
MTTLARLLGRAGVRIACLALLGAGLGSCGGGGPGIPPLAVVLFNFSPGFGGVALNAPLELRFSAPVDLDTVTPDTIRIFTTTTTTDQPDPGAPAIGDYEVTGDVVVFRPRIPRRADLTDAGLRIGFTYAIQVPASPDVIDPVRTIEGDPNVVSFIEFFTTLNSTILPAPGDIPAEPNLPQLYRFFIDEFDYTNSLGLDECDRLQRDGSGQPILDSFGNPIPAFPGALSAPQVIDSDPSEGESGFGTITGIVQGLGTAFVRLDPITLLFSEPVSPWRIRAQNVSIRNVNLGGETFDLFMFFTQDRSEVKLQITVFDADSAFDQASVPQGRYVLTLTQFTDLAGNPLVNPRGMSGCEASGTFELSFSTVSSPSLPTDVTLTFQDDDGNAYVDYGGLGTANHDSNLLPQHMAPFLGGLAVDYVPAASPSNQSSSANWGDTAMWTGAEVRYDNGYDPNDATRQVPQAMRLRGGTNTGATPILCPIAGRATGASDPAGSTNGTVAAPGEPGKVDFFVEGAQTIELFTGNAATGPIVYNYNRFDLLEDTATGEKPVLMARKTTRDDSLFPLIILVEDDVVITGTVNVDGKNGEFGFNGPNDFDPAFDRNPGGLGGYGGPGGGYGGDGGASTLGSDQTLVDGQNGGVPFNVIGPLDQLSEAVAGLTGMSTGGGGLYNEDTPKEDANNDDAVDSIPNFQGGGGGGTRTNGNNGADSSGTTPGITDHGRGGLQVGTTTSGFFEGGILAPGGAGGGGGAGDDDGGGTGTLLGLLEDGVVDSRDDGGGGGGGGGGFFGIACRGDMTLGSIDIMDPMDPMDDIVSPAFFRCVGGRGGSTWDESSLSGTSPPVPIAGGDQGQGEAGGGGGGGGIAIIAGGTMTVTAMEAYAFGKLGGNSPNIEGGDRTGADEAGAGGGGKIYMADSNGFGPGEVVGNLQVFLQPDPTRPGLTPEQQQDFAEMSGQVVLLLGIWGDEPREAMFGATQIVTECFDTLSDSTSYDGALILWNAPRFPYSGGSPSLRTMRIFVDTVKAGPGGLPDIAAVEAPDGTFALDPSIGFTQEVPEADAMVPAAYQMEQVLPAGAGSLGKRFVRLRIKFDPTLISTDPNVLLGPAPLGFAPPGGALLPIADDPATPGLENTRGNLDTAPQGVPAIAEVRVTFTP